MSTPKYEIGAPYGAADGPLATSPTGPLSSFFGFIERIATEIIRYRAFRTAEKELHALDDRMLKDIGINRGEIRSALTNATDVRRKLWRI
ncbi:DUF1127 domain-containing protein [Hyphomicrobium sp. CS1BSMeth3]|uniref:DUF1127 domain-containing protein n=1 Tax=Hyphomicrobium sp. CS1BSMeth3 TaxID=1892844 RepID=UPI00092FE7CA|nr:DUF1127 domain-containing protein [Hyphomicrobium sp. CS1BSMeth3]